MRIKRLPLCASRATFTRSASRMLINLRFSPRGYYKFTINKLKLSKTHQRINFHKLPVTQCPTWLISRRVYFFSSFRFFLFPSFKSIAFKIKFYVYFFSFFPSSLSSAPRSPVISNYRIRKQLSRAERSEFAEEEPESDLCSRDAFNLRELQELLSRDVGRVKIYIMPERSNEARALSLSLSLSLSLLSSLIRRRSQVFPWQWNRTLNEVPPAAAISRMRNASRSDVATRGTYLLAFPTWQKFPPRYTTNNFPVNGSRAHDAESSEVLPIP